MKENKRNHLLYLVFLILAAIFIILKVQRGIEETDEQGGIWNLIQVLFVVSGFISLFVAGTQYRSTPAIVYYLIFSIWIWFLSAFPLINKSIRISDLFSFLTVPYGCMVMLLFFNLGIRNNIKRYWWILLTVFYAIILMLFFAFRYYTGGRESDYGTVADIYYVIGLLPLAMMYMPKGLSIIPFLLATFVVMLTGKRGALVAIALVLAIYYLVPRAEDISRRRRNPLVSVFTFVVVALGAYFVMTKATDVFNLRMFDRLANLESDEGSGRLGRWGIVIREISNEQSLFRMLFGHGDNSIVKMIGGHAHNDFLEFAYNYGFPAVLLYIMFFIALIHKGVQMFRSRYKYANEFICSVVIALCLAVYSFYAVDCTHITCSSICLGLLLADYYKYKNGLSEQDCE